MALPNLLACARGLRGALVILNDARHLRAVVVLKLRTAGPWDRRRRGRDDGGRQRRHGEAELRLFRAQRGRETHAESLPLGLIAKHLFE
jgi:hypothetical protein